jgi:hypothetical protein
MGARPGGRAGGGRCPRRRTAGVRERLTNPLPSAKFWVHTFGENMIKHCRVTLGLLFSAALLSMSASADPPNPLKITLRVPAPSSGPPAAALPFDAFERLDVEAAVQSVYARFAEVTRQSGQTIQFALSEIQSYRPHQFAALRVVDLVQPTDGAFIATIPEGRSGLLPSQEVVRYHSEWAAGHPQSPEEFERAASALSLAEGLAMAGPLAGLSNFPIVAVTAYRVAVTFEGRTVHYRALITWWALSADELYFGSNDEVIPALATANLEDRPIVGQQEGELPTLPEAPQAVCSQTYSQPSGLPIVLQDSLDHGPPVQLPPAPIPLRRLEPSAVVHHGQVVRYLMAEWAVVERSDDQIVIKQRSPDFEESMIKPLAEWSLNEPSRKEAQTVLFAALPSHETNSRAIQVPDLELTSASHPPLRDRGRILVLADFDEDHRLTELSLLHREGDIGSRDLMLHLERSLRLERTEERHRVVTFAWLAVDETVSIESFLSYLPRCCCGTVFCV